MIIRYLLGPAFHSSALIERILSDDSDMTWQIVANNIQKGIDTSFLDVDQYGEVTALGDGLMIIRYLWNLPLLLTQMKSILLSKEKCRIIY